MADHRAKDSFRMLRSLFLTGAAASAVLAAPAMAGTKLTDYAVQTSGNYSSRGGNDIYGRVAVGGNVNANADRLGTHLSAANANSPRRALRVQSEPVGQSPPSPQPWCPNPKASWT